MMIANLISLCKSTMTCQACKTDILCVNMPDPGTLLFTHSCLNWGEPEDMIRLFFQTGLFTLRVFRHTVP